MTLEQIFQNVVEGEMAAVEAGVRSALEQGIPADRILNEALIQAMAKVGRLFEEGEIFVPEMLFAARAMQTGLKLLKPALAATDVQSAGKVAIGTVQGDLHDIGKNLVVMMLEGAGFEVEDLGTDVPPEKFVQAVQNGAQVIGMSALLTTTMASMLKTMEALRAAGVREHVKVVIGGAPVTDAYARKIGADAYAADASVATRIVRQLIA